MSYSSDTQVLELEPADAEGHIEEAISYLQQRKLKEARASLREALRHQPDHPNAHNNLGNVFFYQRRYDSALASYKQALGLKPDFVDAYINLANTLSFLGRYEEALTSCQQALRLRPKCAEVYNGLGNAFKGLGKQDEAVGYYRQALRLQPHFPEAHNNLGLTLAQSDQLDEAVVHYREALRLNPNLPDPCRNLGVIFIKRGNLDDAVALLQQALALEPNDAEAYYNLGLALGQQGKLKEAGKCFQQALRLKPDFVDAHLARAHNRLVHGNFRQGMLEYEWRWQLRGSWLPPFHKPFWDGCPLAGRTILLHAEQGLGDTIQFVRYTVLVKRCGGIVMLACQKPLVPLLRGCPGIDLLVAVGSKLPPFDVQALLLSLPRILKTSLRTVPADIPYLYADVKLQGKWQRQLSRYSGFKIGIAWQGNPKYPGDPERSIPLVHFERLAEVKNICLISLQKGAGREQLHARADRFPVIDLGSSLDEKSGAFTDTAAIMKNLDLVITSDTAIAHLAGALGVPVWLALSFVPEWRWLLQREDSPWYPTMRLFRQRRAGDWKGVFDRMAKEVQKAVADPCHGSWNLSSNSGKARCSRSPKTGVVAKSP